MTYSPPEDRPGWRTAPSDGTSSHDAIPPHAVEGGGRRTALLAAVGGLVALVVVAGVMLVSSGGDGDEDGNGDAVDRGVVHSRSPASRLGSAGGPRRRC